MAAPPVNRGIAGKDVVVHRHCAVVGDGSGGEIRRIIGEAAVGHRSRAAIVDGATVTKPRCEILGKGTVGYRQIATTIDGAADSAGVSGEGAVPELKMAPPKFPGSEFPEKVLFVTVSRPWLQIAAPPFPEFPEKVLFVTVRLPELKMAPPAVF